VVGGPGVRTLKGFITGKQRSEGSLAVTTEKREISVGRPPSAFYLSVGGRSGGNNWDIKRGKYVTSGGEVGQQGTTTHHN